MNLVKLKIDGFLSYREPVEIDFQDIELACISGANGAGKSSLLDAITWVLFCEARKIMMTSFIMLSIRQK